MPFTYEMTAATDIGQVRESNEDCLRIVPSINLAVLADGMGGHKAGDIASHIAVECLSEYLLKQTGITGDISLDAMANGFLLANNKVYTSSHRLRDCEGMGTTLISGSFQPDHIYIGHIGDSRMYRFSHGKLEQLSTDHTLAVKLKADMPKLPLPAYSHHILRKALGIDNSCDPDFFTVTPEHNQIYLMCSDGLTSAMKDHDISTILALRAHQPEHCLETMIDACIENGGPDNISIILIWARQVRQ